MICKLCQEKEANKKNTHYLTDAIIRNCLNQDGSNERENGFYFSMDNLSPFLDFNFQRGTSVEKLEKELGREPTEEEIQKAMDIPFSVDFIFCQDCEKIFTDIETPFLEKILPNFRSKDLSKTDEICFDKDLAIICYCFFYLQVWRTAICEDIFNLEDDTMEKMRKLILSKRNLELEMINFPIHVTYLETLGGKKAYTENYVFMTDDRNPNIIFMNDFVLQFFEDKKSINIIDFHGLNSSGEFENLINIDTNQFCIKIMHNEERKKLLYEIVKQEKVKNTTAHYRKTFTLQWFHTTGKFPNLKLIDEYIYFLTEGDFDILRYTEETITKKTISFIESKVR